MPEPRIPADPCSSRSLGCSQRRLEVDKAHLLQHMELGASCPQAAAGRARGAAPEPAARACPHPHAPVPCQDPSPPAAWGGTWALIRAGLSSWHKDVAQPHNRGEGALAAVQDGARGLRDLKREEWTLRAPSWRRQGQAAGAPCPPCHTHVTVARPWGHTSLGTGDGGTDLNPF